MAKQLHPQDRAIRIQAAALSVLMHVFLFLAMIFMIDWKAVHVNPSVMQATLWDSLPSKQSVKPVTQPVEPTPPPPEPEPKPPESEPPPPQPRPDPQVKQAEQEAQIALKKQEDEKKKELEQKKQEEKLKKLQQTLRKQEEEDKLKKIQEAMLQQDMKSQQAAASSAVDPSVLGYYAELMKRKIRSNVNSGLCPISNPELAVDMQLTVTGDISSMPKLVKGSGDAVCDDAVMRAVLSAKPFDLPSEDHPAERRKMLDQIRLNFRPRG